MLLISVLQVKKELGQKESFRFTITADQLDLGDVSPYTESEMIVAGSVINLGDSLLVEGTIEACSHYECNRCLEAFERKEKIVFDECFREKGQPLSSEQSKDDFLTYEGDAIKLDEIVREHLLLNEPLQPLCSEDCLGLCPICGVNRNKTKCNCTLTTVDPRLAVLSQLIQKNS